jgi:hypothetical protein
MDQRCNDSDRRKLKDASETCPSTTLSTTNPGWTDLGMNLRLRGQNSTTNRLSYGTSNEMK